MGVHVIQTPPPKLPHQPWHIHQSRGFGNLVIGLPPAELLADPRQKFIHLGNGEARLDGPLGKHADPKAHGAQLFRMNENVTLIEASLRPSCAVARTMFIQLSASSGPPLLVTIA